MFEMIRKLFISAVDNLFVMFLVAIGVKFCWHSVIFKLSNVKK